MSCNRACQCASAGVTLPYQRWQLACQVNDQAHRGGALHALLQNKSDMNRPKKYLPNENFFKHVLSAYLDNPRGSEKILGRFFFFGGPIHV